jgi:hypothetical protein
MQEIRGRGELLEDEQQVESGFVEVRCIGCKGPGMARAIRGV